MPTRLYTFTSAGGESAGYTIGHWPLPAFTGNFTIDITASPPAGGTSRFGIGFYKAAGGPACFVQELVFIAGDTTKGAIRTVGVPGFDWSCADWDTMNWYVAGPTSPLFGGITWTLAISGPGVPDMDAGYCQYGTEPTSPGQEIVQITAQLVAQLIPEAGLWAIPIALLSMGLYISVPTLCSSPPPADPTWDPIDWITKSNTYPGSEGMRKTHDKLIRALWLKFCKCKPATGGGSAPITYIDAHWEKPTWYVTDTQINISNTDIAVTLNEVYRILNTNTWNTNNTYNTVTNNTTTITNIDNSVTEIKGCACGDEYIHGTVHYALIDEDQFSVTDLVGIEVQILTRPGGIVLPGNPDYLWNMGWLTVKTDGYMVEERRLTRDQQIWFPHNPKGVTEVGWQLNPGVSISITELIPPATP